MLLSLYDKNDNDNNIVHVSIRPIQGSRQFGQILLDQKTI